MPSFTWALVIFSALGSMTMFGLFLADIMTTGNNPFILWVQSVPPLEFLLLFGAFIVLIAVLLRPRRRRP